jgi:hypothetical protein
MQAIYRCFTLIVILTLLASLTAACSGSVPRAEQLAVAPPQPPAEAGMAEAPATSGESDVGNFSRITPIEQVLDSSRGKTDQTQVIIYTANLGLVVADTRVALKSITDLAAAQGGYVASSNIYQVGNVPRGSITIRVPAQIYLDTLEKLRALAVRVDSENSGTQDVSEEYTDLEARKTNLEYTEQALQQLLEERQRVGSTSDVLEVYRELTDVRGQIEQIEGRMRYLANQAALSTITIELIPDVLSQPVSVGGWEPQGVAKEALQALITALQVLVNILIWLVILILPLLIILLLPVALVIWLISLWWKRRQKRRAAATPPKSPPPATPPAKAE